MYYEGLESLEIDRAVLGGPDIEQRFNAPPPATSITLTLSSRGSGR